MDPDKWPVDEKPISITRSVVKGHEHEYQVFAYGEPVVRGSDGRLDVSRVRGKRKELYHAEGEPAFSREALEFASTWQLAVNAVQNKHDIKDEEVISVTVSMEETES